VSAIEDTIDLAERFLGGRAAELGARTGTETFRRLAPELDDAIAPDALSACASVLAGNELDSADLVP
jgi:hypothetical protein